MPSTDSTARPDRTFGPIRIVGTSLGCQLFGLVLAFVGLQVVSWAFWSLSLSSTVLYTAVGAFVVFNGLYLGGVRFR